MLNQFLLLLTLGLGLAQGQTLVWSKFIGNEALQTLKAIRTDAEGNIILFGTFNSYPMDSGAPRNSFGGTDVFLHKMDPSGKTLWFRNMGSEGNGDKALDMDVDSVGNIYVLADLNSFLGVPGFFLSSESDTLKTDSKGYRSETFGKYSPSGKVLWIRQFQSGAVANLGQIRVCNGKVVIAGDSYGTVKLLGATDSLLPSRAGLRGFLAELNGDGGILSMADVDSVEVVRLVRSDGHGGLFLGSSKLLKGGQAYLERRHSNGEKAWRRPMEVETGVMTFQDLISDGSGNIYVGGRYESGTRVNLGEGRDTLVYGRNPPNFYLMKLDLAGNMVWYNFGLDGYSPFSNFTLAPDRSLTLMSFSSGQTWRLDPAGKVIWNFKASSGGIQNELPPGTALDPDGAIVFGVTIMNRATFLGHTFTSAGIENIVLFKVSGPPTTIRRLPNPEATGSYRRESPWWMRFLLTGRKQASNR